MQISATLVSTMHGESIGKNVVDDLARFVQRLSPPPAARKQADETLVEAGQQVFQRLKCNECHRPPEFTSPITRDVGLEDEVGNRKFNPPSLRGLSHRRAFFHDARAKSLRSVVREYQHQLPSELTGQELEQLLAYLSTL
jgi:cytochrome c peroxidase